jgi:hypothetical protein
MADCLGRRLGLGAAAALLTECYKPLRRVHVFSVHGGSTEHTLGASIQVMDISFFFISRRGLSALAAWLACALLTGTVSAQPAQRRPAAPPGVDLRSELRRDVTDEQYGRSEGRTGAFAQRHLSAEQRAELRRQLREQARVLPDRADSQR